MTGISLDLFTVILLVVLAFTWGYSAGKNVGANQVKNFVSDTINSVTKTLDEENKKKEKEKAEIAKLMKNPDGSIKSFGEFLNGMLAKKEQEKGDDDQP